jgi:hypothetical protein
MVAQCNPEGELRYVLLSIAIIVGLLVNLE